MRRASGYALVGLFCAASLAGASPAKVAPPSPRTSVYLNSAADLEHLRESNFNHYLRAQKILAAANEICRPGKETTYFARFDGADPRCLAMLWKTSNPPKKQLTFKLDDVRYIALVSVTDNPARIVKAEGSKR
jgi:hypothetical protein